MKSAVLFLAVMATGCSVTNIHFSLPSDGSGGGDAPPSPTDAALPPDGPPPASGDYYWLRSLSQVSTQTLAAGPSGVVTPGYLSSTADLGTGTLTSAGGPDQIVAAFAANDGSDLYAVRHGAAGSEFGLIATIDSSGVPLVGGITAGNVDLGLGPVPGSGVNDGYLGRYAAGVPSWVNRVLGPAGGNAKIVAAPRGPGASVWEAGWFEGTSTFNGTNVGAPLTLTSAGGRDIFFAQINTFTGAVQIAPKVFGGALQDQLSAGAGNPTDSSTFVLAGYYKTGDTLDFGGTASAISATQGGVDIWVAKFDANGDGVWATTFGGAGDDLAASVAVDGNGDVYVTGTFNITMTVGTTVLNAVGGVCADDFIAKLNGATGAPVWALSSGTPGMVNAATPPACIAGNETGGTIAVDTAGHLAFAEPLGPGIYNGGETKGGVDARIAEYTTSNGTLIWEHLYSTSGDDRGGGVAYAPNGDLFAAITLGGPYDFGQTVIGDPDPVGVLMRIQP